MTVLASFALILSLSSPGQDARPAAGREITVTGSGEVRIPPDEIVLTVGVETSDMNLLAARDQNDQRIRAMMKAAGARGIPPEHLKTDYVHIEPRYEDYGTRKFLGYFVRKTLIVTVRDVPSFEATYGELLQAGATHVHDVQFRTTELRRHRDEARRLAIRAAREKAEALARELGQAIGAPERISESSGWYWGSSSSWWGSRWGSQMTQNAVQTAAAAGDTGTALAPGLISVRADVSVSFALR